jgi:hypothetical protein
MYRLDMTPDCDANPSLDAKKQHYSPRFVGRLTAENPDVKLARHGLGGL